MHNAFPCHVISIKPLTERIAQLYIKPQTHFTYEAGQYIEVIQDGQNAYLSIANAPQDNQLEFHLFHAADNPKAQSLLQLAQQEKQWIIKGPYGSCTVNHLNNRKPIIFLARGTGFAPVKAVIETLLAQQAPMPIYLYWSVKTKSDLYLLDVIEAWQKQNNLFHFSPIFTEETGSHIPPSVILKQHADLSNYQVYVSGPKPLVMTAYHDFSSHGLQREWFFSDVFSLNKP